MLLSEHAYYLCLYTLSLKLTSFCPKYAKGSTFSSVASVPLVEGEARFSYNSDGVTIVEALDFLLGVAIVVFICKGKLAQRVKLAVESRGARCIYTRL